MEDNTGIEIKNQDDVTIITFNAGSIRDTVCIEEVAKQIKQFIADSQPRKIVIDFAKVKFFTSQTLGLLLDVWRRLQANNGKVVISGINPQLHRVFKITNLDKIFSFFPDCQTAVREIGRNTNE